MENIPDKYSNNYQNMVSQISETYSMGHQKAVMAVNSNMVETYWKIGQYIIEFEQEGNLKAQYGAKLLERLAKDLTLLHGKGFSLSNLKRMRQFFICYPICATLSHQLSWSNYIELLKIDNELERSFYEKQSILENWNVRELQRQKRSSLFLRLAASKDKEGILLLSRQGQIVQHPSDLIREPYVLEFLKIPEPYHLTEMDLETRLIEHLQHFLLELGKGFAFIAVNGD
jgi:predicted nuclease of restriction endonuclease-like (RecB) superfamily